MSTLWFGKFTGKQIDAMSQREKGYLLLQSIEVERGVLGLLLNRYGASNLTVCPRCHIDDFTHVEDCEVNGVPCEFTPVENNSK